MELSIFTFTPVGWRSHSEKHGLISRENALMLAGAQRTERTHFFRDLQTGMLLCLNANHTFSVMDPGGYTSGIIRAQRMAFKGNGVTVWHQDERFSFTCQADLRSGFCFGWLVDRSRGKSYRILDPGRIR